jgi:hypothetical protein
LPVQDIIDATTEGIGDARSISTIVQHESDRKLGARAAGERGSIRVRSRKLRLAAAGLAELLEHGRVRVLWLGRSEQLNIPRRRRGTRA